MAGDDVPAPCPHCGVAPEGYDALMRELRRTRSWGRLSIDLKDGAAVKIELNESYKTPADALRRRSSPPEAIPA